MMSVFFLLMAATGAAVTTLVTRRFLIHWSIQRAKSDRQKAKRCGRWLIECAAGPTDDGTFYPSKLTMCTVFAKAECSAFFAERGVVLPPRTKKQRRSLRKIQLRGGIEKASDSPGHQVAPVYTHLVAGYEMGSSELAAYVNAAGWGTFFVVFYLFRKVCVRKQWLTEAVETGGGVRGASAGRSSNGSRAHDAAAFDIEAAQEPDGPDNHRMARIARRSNISINARRRSSLPVSWVPATRDAGYPTWGAACTSNEGRDSVVAADFSPLMSPRRVASVRGASRSPAQSAEDLDSKVGGVDGADGSGEIDGAEWVSFDMAEGEELEASSFMPMVVAGSGGGRIRRWCFEDLVSRADGGRAKVVGGGSFAQVARTTMADGMPIAVKTMARWHPTLGSQDKFLDREIELLKECGAHPNVVDSLGYMKTTSRVLLMMPIIPTDIDAMVQDHPLSDAATQNFIRQLLSALEHLHEKGILHRDVKAKNLLIENETTLLLADFGIAKKISPDKEYLSNVIGTMSYMAPEMLVMDEGDVRYNAKVDLWAAGVTTHEMLSRKTPFRSVTCADAGTAVEEAKGGTAGASREEKGQSLDFAGNHDPAERANILAGRATLDASLGPEAFDFIPKLLAGDVGKRPSAHEAAEHEWLGGASEAAKIRAKASTVVSAREAELKSERAQLVVSRRRVPRRVLKGGPTRELGGDDGTASGGVGEGGCGKRHGGS